MSACIGWPADPPCTVHGRVHGCGRPGGHDEEALRGSRAKWHVCPCGAVAQPDNYRTRSGELAA